MSASTVIITVLGGGLVLAFALLDYGGEQIIAGFGRAVIRLVTLGRIRLRESDDSTALGIGAATIITFFLGLFITFAIVT